MKKIGIYAGIVLLFLVLAYGFVPEVLTGKIVNQSDITGYEQYVMATAPPIARTLSTPNESINRKAPNKEMNSQLAGLFPFIRRLYNDCVQSPSLEGTNEVVGIPPNMESVQ